MIAVVFVLIAVAVRLLPHPFHFTPVAAALLYFGARRPARQFIFPISLLIASDVYLTIFHYGYPFHPAAYLWTWLWYAGTCFLGTRLREHSDLPRVAASAFAASISFFLLSNFSVWLEGTMYSKDPSGLIACYTNAIPFFRNTVASDLCFTLIAFGLPVLASKVLSSFRRPSMGTA